MRRRQPSKRKAPSHPLLWRVTNKNSKHYGKVGFLVQYPGPRGTMLLLGNVQGPTTYGKAWQRAGMPHPAQGFSVKRQSATPVRVSTLPKPFKAFLKKRLTTLWAVAGPYPKQLLKKL